VKSSSIGADEVILGGRYALEQLVGHGSSARVYTATDRSLGRKVAVKLLHAGLASDGPFRRRFESEARHAASLNHPNLLAIYDWAEGDQVYLVTELLGGGSLRALLDAGHRLTPSQVVLVGLQAGSGLAHAHAEGFVHRDIKPANLMFTDTGRLKIADFGISRAVAEASWTEPDGALIGTARYAAPEQALGRGIDGRADVYSLGLTMIEALTGEVPLVGANPLATMVLRQDTDVTVDAALGPLGEVLAATGRSDAGERPDAVELVAMLESAASTLPRPGDLPLVGLQSPAAAVDDDLIVLASGADALVLADRATVGAPEVDPTVPMPAPADGTQDDTTDSPPPVIAGDGGSSPADDDDRDHSPNRRWWWLLVGVLIVVGVGFSLSRFGVVDAVFDEATPEPVTFPVGTYVGRDIDAVTTEIEQNGWIVESSLTRADGSAPGEVLTQTPVAGVQREAGAVIVLVVSEGALLRDVPQLEGLSLAEAEQALAAEGLLVGSVEREFDEVVAEGAVLRSSAVPGVQLETGDRVDLVISAGPEPRLLPDLRGRSQAEAEAALIELGLVAVLAEDYSETVAQGMVIASDPPPESSVERGGSVTITISLGLPFVRVPDVSGLSAAAAADQLTALGFVVSDTDGPPNRDVIATDPPAGDSLRKGSEIIIFTRRS
jgi:serine/threonine protein kinase/beta-lactam-binding protein with PASTA domain